MPLRSSSFLHNRPSDRVLLVATFTSLILVLPLAILAGFSVLLLVTPVDPLSTLTPFGLRIILFAYFVTCPLVLICAGSLPWLCRHKEKFALGWGIMIGFSLYCVPALLVIIAFFLRLFV